MIRDISNIQRDLSDTKNNDIIYKKAKIKEILEADPDLSEILGKQEPRPLNSYVDKNHPTEEERKKRQEILDYNEKIQHEQIVDYLKLDDIQEEVLNFVMYDIEDRYPDNANEAFKEQYLTVVCLCHENDMNTEYGIQRADLLAYIVTDLLNWTNEMGVHLQLYSDVPTVTSKHYYGRTLKFYMKAINSNRQKNNIGIRNNVYDRLP